jgi:hypothetical protein
VTIPRSFREILRDELPGLVKNAVLDPATADRLNSHYALDALGDRHATRKVVLALLGCLLVGAGIILLFAHNWDELSRPMRAAVSLGQLAIAQAIAGYVVLRHPKSTAGLEGSGALLTLSVGAAIALISQTYHLGGELGDFMLAWIVLAVPLIYALPARSVATLVLLGAPVLAFERARDLDHGFAYWVALAATLPALSLREHGGRADGLTLLARWAFVVTLPIAAGPLTVDHAGGPWLPFYAGLAASCVALGVTLENGASAPRRPFSIAGGLGTVALLLALSYDEVVDEVLRSGPSYHGYLDRAPWTGLAAAASAVLVVGIAAVLARNALRERDNAALALLAANVVAVAIYGLAHARVSEELLAWLASGTLLVLGGALLAQGLSAQSASLSNKGLGVLTVLFGARFFDSELSFVVRGVAFVALGIAFLAINMMLSRKKEEATP